MSGFRAILIALVLLVGGGIFAVVMFKSHQEDKRLDTEGQTVQGEVIGGSETRRRRGGRSYKLEVQYASADRKVNQRKEFSTNSDMYRQAEQSGYVPVTYLPSDPKVARIGGSRSYGVGSALGAAACLAGAGMLFYMIRKRAGGTVTPVAPPAPAGGYPYPPQGGFPQQGTYPPQGGYQQAPGGYPPPVGQPGPGGLPPIPPGIPPVPQTPPPRRATGGPDPYELPPR